MTLYHDATSAEMCVRMRACTHDVCVCVCVYVCVIGHTSLALVGMVCHPNSPGWLCLGFTSVHLLGGVPNDSMLI